MTLWVTLGPIPALINFLDLCRGADALTSIQATVALLVDDPLERGHHALPLIALASHVHPALDGDVRVRDARGEQLAQGTEVEGVLGCDTPLLLQEVLHLLEHGVLQDGVDDQHQGRSNTGKEAQGTLLANQSKQSSECGGRLDGRRARQDLLIGLILAGRHACVDDPDGVGEEHGS